jgi:hypothetical protein
MYLMRRQTTLSLSEIGRFFDRDHTTVIHACSKIERLMAEDRTMKDTIERPRRGHPGRPLTCTTAGTNRGRIRGRSGTIPASTGGLPNGPKSGRFVPGGFERVTSWGPAC